MRNDHAFHGDPARRSPSAENVEHYMRAARRLRAEAVHDLLGAAWESARDAFGRIRGALRRRPAAKLQTC